MTYSLDYIRNYMNKLDEITGFNSKNIKLCISKRLTSTYAYCQMKYNQSQNIKDRILLSDKVVFSDMLLNCGATEKQINDIIKHEYCHAWADANSHNSYGHKGKFKQCCNKLKCNGFLKSKDLKLDKLCNEYLKNRKNNYKDIFNNLTWSVKYKDENYIRVNTIINNNIVQVSVSITEKYKDMTYLFNDTVKEIKNILTNHKNVEFNSIKYTINKKGFKKAIVEYNHLNLIKK